MALSHKQKLDLINGVFDGTIKARPASNPPAANTAPAKPISSASPAPRKH
jgi:hypothetical protein